MRHIISDQISVIIFETCNPISRESTERYSYYVEYTDSDGHLRESEIQNGFIGAEHCISDAFENLDALDMTPEVRAQADPSITTPYHLHLCNAGCGNHRCVSPACMSKGEFPRLIAEIICPGCNVQTGTRDYFKRQRYTIAEYMPLVGQRAVAA
jgi:hypothetical protein